MHFNVASQFTRTEKSKLFMKKFHPSFCQNLSTAVPTITIKKPRTWPGSVTDGRWRGSEVVSEDITAGAERERFLDRIRRGHDVHETVGPHHTEVGEVDRNTETRMQRFDITTPDQYFVWQPDLGSISTIRR